VKSDQTEIARVLRERLNLTDLEYDLEVLSNGKVSGSDVSDAFAGTTDIERQRSIWSALDAEYGENATRYVGTLLAYTQGEWNIDLTGSRNHKE